MTGCRPGQTGDGLIHESGDVAVRVTPDGLIVVDDNFASQAADVLSQIKKMSPLPVKYVLNSHHHADHASGNQHLRDTLGSARQRLGLRELGWDNSVSTTTWFGGLEQYYDEIAASR
jgi:glyoxylase-like metal-dependent hydrolase (beta-lactamase superfamily II)